MKARVMSGQMFLSNKYTNWYWSIISHALQREQLADLILERHHILPKGKYLFPQFKSLKDNPWNGVHLTLREHYICHLLLTKMTTGETKRAVIYALMRFSSGPGKCSSRQYAKAKALFKLARRGCSSSLRGRPGRKWTDEEKRRHSQKMKKVMNNETTKQKCSIAKLGKPGQPLSQQHKDAISLAQRTLSPEQRKRKSDAKLGNKNGTFGKVWVTDGQKAMLVLPTDIPAGFSRGR
jgi:hypothetical protein